MPEPVRNEETETRRHSLCLFNVPNLTVLDRCAYCPGGASAALQHRRCPRDVAQPNIFHPVDPESRLGLQLEEMSQSAALEARVANYLRYLPQSVKVEEEARVVVSAVVDKLMTDPTADIGSFLLVFLQSLQNASNYPNLEQMCNFLTRLGTSLHWAVRMGDSTMVADILAAGIVDVDAKDEEYGCTALHMAIKSEKIHLVRELLERGTMDVNAVDEKFGCTALHMGVETRNIHIVRELLKHEGMLRLTEESKGGETPLEYARTLRLTDVQRALMECEPVRRYVELYRARLGVYVDSAIAILVGAALIASVTFTSWVQPPLGYATTFECLRAFWVFNSLAFYSAIATVIFGVRSVLPRRKRFLRHAVERLRVNLIVTSILLAFSVFFVTIAFGIACSWKSCTNGSLSGGH